MHAAKRRRAIAEYKNVSDALDNAETHAHAILITIAAVKEVRERIAASRAKLGAERSLLDVLTDDVAKPIRSCLERDDINLIFSSIQHAMQLWCSEKTNKDKNVSPEHAAAHALLHLRRRVSHAGDLNIEEY